MTVEKLDLSSPDVVQGNIEKIRALFPNVVTEGPDGLSIDFDALRQELSDTIVEGPQERYRLDWPGKRAAMLAANTPISKTLRPVREESVDFDTTQNLFIEGDNLDALKLLQDSYLGKVKMIYIDPPYNTGNDFVYDDNFTKSRSQADIESGFVSKDGERLVANLASNGRFHSDWLSMMQPRLKLARNLLKDDGVLFISIDENEVANLKSLCSSIFGSANFLFQATLLCNPKGRSQDKYIANCHEYILAFSKTDLAKGALDVRISDQEIAKNYPLADNLGNYRELELRNTHREFGKHNRPNLYYPFFVNKTGELSLEESPGSAAVYPTWNDGFEGCWTWGKEKSHLELNFLLAKEVGGAWKVYRKGYASLDGESAKKKVKSIWTDRSFHTEKGQSRFNSLFKEKNKLFQSPKSPSMLGQLLEMGAREGGIVMDFFVGSGSFFDAAFCAQSDKDGPSYNCIGVQLPENTDPGSYAYKAGYKTIADLSKERIRRAGAKILDENPDQVGKLDVGFRVLKIDSSNMKDVHADPRELKQGELLDAVSHIKPDRSGEDLLFQVMLNQGIELSQSMARESVEGKTVYIVGQDNLIACFDDNITDDVVKDIAGRKPLYAIFRDESFKEPADKINAAQIFKQLTEGHTHMKVI